MDSSTRTVTASPNNQYDEAIAKIAQYLKDPMVHSEEAFQTARICLADTIGCGLLALNFPDCTKLLGPLVEATTVPNGSRVPGTNFELDPIRAAFNIGTMNRWLDFNDTWLAAEWGHPSDNLGGILAITDYLTRSRRQHLTVGHLLKAMIQAHEIQGSLALLNSFNKIGFDHVILVKVATAAVTTNLMGGSQVQICDSISNAWIDTGALRTYRHSPNTGSRKSWAAGDATSRGLQIAWMTMQGENGYPTALSAPKWGLYDVLFQGKPFSFQRPLGAYVMENILFKIAYPAEFHAQTAVECAILLHPLVEKKLAIIDTIEISTTESTIKIIDKTGPLHNHADRDHCIQYIVAVAMLYGSLTAEDYLDKTAKDPRIDELRKKMIVKENKQFTQDYLDPSKRSIANSITVQFTDGSTVGPMSVEYPLGHRRRRQEGMPLLFQKFANNVGSRFSQQKTDDLMTLFQDPVTLEKMSVSELMNLFISEDPR